MINCIKYITPLVLLMGLSSCYKEDIQPPNPPTPIITDSTQIDSTYNLIGQVWVISSYRIGEFGEILPLNDTIEFISSNQYTYNGGQSPYSFYPTASAFNLTLNYTPFGNISGTIYAGNLFTGKINGLKFTDITFGSGNQTNYYLWMTKQ
jgi:hypothetical protein